MELIDKDALIAEIEDKINKYTKRGEESDAKRDGYGMYWGGVISCLNEIRSLLDTIEVKEVDLTDRKTNWHPSNKQIESLHDMLKYNIGVFDYQKFMEVFSLYNDLIKLRN